VITIHRILRPTFGKVAIVQTDGVDDVIALSKARSMLIVLVATCEQALTSLEHVAHDGELDDEIAAVIERSRGQLRSFEMAP
jgi:hypothetical protein